MWTGADDFISLQESAIVHCVGLYLFAITTGPATNFINAVLTFVNDWSVIKL